MNLNGTFSCNVEDEIIGCLPIKFEAMPVDLSIMECTIIVIIWILIQFLGNCLLMGLIQYDRLGGDPLKRRISDQVSNLKLGCNHVHLTVRLGFVTQHLWLGNFGKCNRGLRARTLRLRYPKSSVTSPLS